MQMQQRFLIKNMQLIINLKKFQYYTSVFKSERALRVNSGLWLLMLEVFFCLLVSNFTKGKGSFSGSICAADRRPWGAVLMLYHPHPSLKDQVWPLLSLILLQHLCELQSTAQSPCWWRKPIQSDASIDCIRRQTPKCCLGTGALPYSKM